MAELIPARAHYMISLLDALRTLGGHAPSTLVYEWMEQHGIARAGDLAVIQKDGGSRFRKEVRFARKELFDAGMVENGGPGEWYLTSTGRETYLNHASANEVVRLNQKLRPLRTGGSKKGLLATKRTRRRVAPSWGPKPVPWSSFIARNVLDPAYTYIMRFGDSSVWKIGHAKNLDRRLNEVNKHVPAELINQEWKVVAYQEWENSVLAHAMERRAFELLHASRTVWERVRCQEQVLMEAWASAAEQIKRASAL